MLELITFLVTIFAWFGIDLAPLLALFTSFGL